MKIYEKKTRRKNMIILLDWREVLPEIISRHSFKFNVENIQPKFLWLYFFVHFFDVLP